jgi:hypothetical protein
MPVKNANRINLQSIMRHEEFLPPKRIGGQPTASTAPAN